MELWAPRWSAAERLALLGLFSIHATVEEFSVARGLKQTANIKLLAEDRPQVGSLRSSGKRDGGWVHGEI